MLSLPTDPVAIQTLLARMHAVFALVDPRTHALRAAARGEMPAEQADKVSWRDQIAVLVMDSELVIDGVPVSIGEVERAIIFMTATVPVSHHYSKADNGKGGIEPAWFIRADGYRAGPAGDH